MATTSRPVSGAGPTERRELPIVETSSLLTAIEAHTAAPAEGPTRPGASGRRVQYGEQHSLPLSILLHILPGMVTLVVFLTTGPFVRALGRPEEIARYLFALPVGVILVELGIMFAVSKRQSGRLSLQGAVLYHERMPLWQYGIIGLAVLAWNVVVYVPVQQVTSEWLDSTVFSWVPEWFSAVGDYSAYPMTGLAAICALFVVVGGVSGGVEELYFRGYLLPRLSRFMWWSPVMNTLLFSLYHLDMLGSIAAVFVGSLPLAYVAYWKKNVVLSMVMHAGLNVVFMLLWFVPLLLH